MSASSKPAVCRRWTNRRFGPYSVLILLARYHLATPAAKFRSSSGLIIKDDKDKANHVEKNESVFRISLRSSTVGHSVGAGLDSHRYKPWRPRPVGCGGFQGIHHRRSDRAPQHRFQPDALE